LNDDELARFADQLLVGGGSEKLEIAGEDQELIALEKLVVRLDHAFRAAEPDRAMSSRIKANLMKEWQRSVPTSGQPQAAGLAAVAAAVAVALLVLPFLLAGGAITPTPGAAQNNLSLSPVFVVGGLVVIAGVMGWSIRRKR